ncbi:MAG TPA: hypothetical protein VJ725_06560 [Thermoanaerobaculia bacterium]|nr:hypothetical protein [Thermoanaerobaculia bacterium]
MRSTPCSALRPLVLAFAALALLPSAGRAISQTSEAGSSIPWWNRIVCNDVALQVDVEPLDPARKGVLRERDLLAFRFRLFDGITGKPLAGLAPAAWVEEVSGEGPFDAEKCAQQARQALGGRPLEGLSEGRRPGTYESVTRLGRGRYEVVFLLDAPRVVQCFQVDVRPARFAWLR